MSTSTCKICGDSFSRGLPGHVLFGHKIDWASYKAGKYKVQSETATSAPATHTGTTATPKNDISAPDITAPETPKNPVLGNDGSKMPASFEEELWVKATPLVRKVALNPEMYFWYDYARGSLDFKGDIGDFVADCVRYFFKNHGYKIQIVKEEAFS